MVPLSFADQQFMALAEDALFWPRRHAILLADLHLEKASFFAKLGQLLPPYDSSVALDRIERIIADTGARELWCLGDSFHDEGAGGRLSAQAQERLRRLTSRIDWVWITGNHDPLVDAPGEGRVETEAVVDGICLRHNIDPLDTRPEISGHWHPKFRLKIHDQILSRRCFVRSPTRLVLPAFGTFTGGMKADDPALLDAVGRPAEALLVVSGQLLRFDLA